MYYTNGNYEAFARPRKPAGVENKQAWLVGSGLASLAAAAFLIRDGQMEGSRIHILEEAELPGGACDGILRPDIGFVIRGGREMENHYECLWDLYRSIPSLEKEGESVLDEFYHLNHDDPNISHNRATLEQGRSANTGNRFELEDEAALELMALFFTPDDQLYNKTIADVLGESFFRSNFWLYWQTMFAFETWHSALEMKRYLQRFLHHIGGLPDLSALKFTKYNQYESLIQPLVAYLKENGVQFEYGVRVRNVLFHFLPGKKVAHQLVLERHGQPETVELTENDLVFVTNGSCTEASALGDNDRAPELKVESGRGSSWELWKNIAVQNPAFGRPEVFCSNIEATKWESATVTLLDDRIAPYVQQVCGRDPYAGKVVTGGIVTVKDSAWLMSWTFNRQPHFKAQPEGQLVGWIYGLYPERPGKRDRDPRPGSRPHGPLHDALHHRLLHAPPGGGPPRRGARRLRELRLPGPVHRDPPGHRLYGGILGAHSHGSRLHPAGCGTGRAGSLRFGIRCAVPAQRHPLPAGRPQTHRHEAAPALQAGAARRAGKGPGHHPGRAAHHL